MSEERDTRTQRNISHVAHVRRLDICRSLCVWGMRIDDVAQNWGVKPSTIKSIHGDNCVMKHSLTPMSDFQYSTKKRSEAARVAHTV